MKREIPKPKDPLGPKRRPENEHGTTVGKEWGEGNDILPFLVHGSGMAYVVTRTVKG